MLLTLIIFFIKRFFNQVKSQAFLSVMLLSMDDLRDNYGISYKDTAPMSFFFPFLLLFSIL